MKTLQNLSNAPTLTKVDDTTIKQVITDMVDKSTAEWQSNKVINSLYSSKDIELSNKSSKLFNQQVGMALYIEACRKYKIKPTNYIGQFINEVFIDKWRARAYRMTFNQHYRDEYYRPMMYKLHNLAK